MRTLICLLIIFGFVPMSGQIFLNDSLQTNQDYFPVRSSFGLEITRHFEQGAINSNVTEVVNDNFEFGINYLFSGWYGRNKNVETVSKFVKHAGLYQFGTFFTANPVNR